MNSRHIKTSQIENFIYALLIFLPTIAYVRIEVYLLFIPIILYKSFKVYTLPKTLFSKLKKDKFLWFIIAIPFFSFLNRVTHFNYDQEGLRGLYSFAYLLPLLYLISKLTLNRDTIKFLIYFIGIEVCIGIIEFLIGQSSFFTNTHNYFEFSNYELLYNTRVFGLAHNSSTFSEKILLGIILLDFINIRYKKIFLSLFLIGLTITFNRTILISYLFYVIFSNFETFIFSFKDLNKKLKSTGYINFIFISLWIISPQYTHNQFTRNNTKVVTGRVINEEFESKSNLFSNSIKSGGIEMSGRGEIWDHFFTFLKTHPFFGNGSKKLIIGKHHAHNSILEVLASHGLIIGILYILMVLIQIKRNNFVVIGTFFVASLGQYIIFWGVSFPDIIFIWFLLPKFQEKLNYDT